MSTKPAIWAIKHVNVKKEELKCRKTIGRPPGDHRVIKHDIYHFKTEKTQIPNIYVIFALEAWYSKK